MFDPLHKWLGIPPNEQPPDDYRLLGVARFESDPEVIDVAADRHLSFLHDLTNGEYADLAESLSNRISAARLKLLSADKKAAYDRQLRDQQPDHGVDGSNDRDESLDVDAVLHSLEEFQSSHETPSPTVSQVLGTPPKVPMAAPPQTPPLPTAGPEMGQPEIAPKRKGPQKRRRRSYWIWLMSIVPGLAVLSVLIYMIATNRLQLDQQKLEDLGIPEEQASKLAGPPPPTVVESTIVVPAETSDPKPNTRQANNQVVDKSSPRKNTTDAANRMAPESLQSKTAQVKISPPTTPPTSTQSVSIGRKSTQPATPKVASAGAAPAPSTLGFKTGSTFGLGRPLPTSAELDEKRKIVSELYKAKYENARTRADKLAIASDMSTAARQTLDDPAGQYALYDAARRIFVAEDDFQSAIANVRRIHETYPRLDHLRLTKEILDKTSPSASRTNEYAQATMRLANECLDAGKVDIGLESVLRAKKSLRRPSKQTVELLKRLHQELLDAQQLFNTYEQQALVIEQTPDDPDALSAVAKYLCLVEDKWHLELQRMAAGSDSFYANAAKVELAHQGGNAKTLKLADVWFLVFEQAKSSLEKRRLADRAKSFYLTARTSSSGIDILKIDQRVSQLQPFATPGALANVVPGSAIGTFDPSEPVKTKAFSGPPRQIQPRTYNHPNYPGDFATIRGRAIRVGMGSTPGGFGQAAAGVELENVGSIRVTGVASAPPARRNPKSSIGFMIDFATSRGFSRRVFLSIEGDRHSITSTSPPWGAARRPDTTDDLGTQQEYVLDLHRWAPTDWNGRCWFTVVMRDAGENRTLSANLQW